MYRVVIAEDSKPILRNIKLLLENTGLPLKAVHTSYNGEDALAYIREHRADILLTDIRMPKLDGLSLIEQALQINRELKVVLISSYSDFEYTRKAINLQVFDYLLKPVDQAQMDEVMGRIVRKIQETDAMRQAVLGDIIAADEIQLDRMFFDHPKRMMLLCRQPFTPRDGWHYETVQMCLAERCAPDPCWLLPLKHPLQMLLFAPIEIKDQYAGGMEWMKDIQHALSKRGLITSAISHFEPVEPARFLSVYHDMEEALRGELTVHKPVLAELHHCRPNPREADGAWEPFAELIQQRQKDAFVLKLQEQLQYYQVKNARWHELQQLCLMIEGAFDEALSELNGEDQTLGQENHERELSPMYPDADDYEAFCGRLIAWSEDQFRKLELLNRKSSDELFAQMDLFIRHHIYSHLTICDLAEQFYISPSYVSRIIKRYTGDTFVQYVTKLKIEEACKQLQAKPDLKIRDLADALSFTDQHYFSRVFKKHTGLTPTEYKEQREMD